MINWSHFIPKLYFPSLSPGLSILSITVCENKKKIRVPFGILFVYICLPFEVAHGFGLAETFLIRTLIIPVKTESQGQPAGCLWPMQRMRITFGISFSNILPLILTLLVSYSEADITGREFYKLPYLLCQWEPPTAIAFLAWTNGEEVNWKSDIDVIPK